jgi:hypothetical protein
MHVCVCEVVCVWRDKEWVKLRCIDAPDFWCGLLCGSHSCGRKLSRHSVSSSCSMSLHTMEVTHGLDPLEVMEVQENHTIPDTETVLL